ncbi:MAG: 16S rRNA (adenine(1518)-N(6)/adenine(1519)-N(6))-dimethyltransferase RsmA [Ignavibacteriaceae bacterium]|jgi:16S rRNA (adenine1518-N6/adenine1519-N6)-dimethyltransferase
MQNLKPLKRFGQNYLHDKNIIKKIVSEINPQPDDTILEIGPGRGALTELIYGKAENFIAVEIDTRVIEDLQLKFPDLQLIQKDFLKVDISTIIDSNKKKLRVIGNIPYNLTSPIIFKTIRNAEFIEDAILTVQNEVAKRMTAKKGSKDYGILTVILNYFTDTQVSFKVSPNAFYPKPKVTSAVVHLRLKELSVSKEKREMFISIVKACFGNRRKILKNSLSNSIFKELNFSSSGINLSLRAEQLNVKEFLVLTEFALNQAGE